MATVGHMTLRPGDVIVQDDARVTVLRHREDGLDPFGRHIARYWSRREDTGAEGFVSFGAGGVVELAEPAPTALVRCASHRAREKMLHALADRRDAVALYSIRRDTGKGVYRVPAALAPELKRIVGVTGYRDGADLHPCWPSPKLSPN